MRLRTPAGAMVAALLAAPGLAAAQESVKSFDQLNTRLKPGDKVWVTDAAGREVAGKIRVLVPDAITIGDGGSPAFRAADVRLIQERRPDSVANGALKGLVVGAGLAGLGCLAGNVDTAFCALMMLGDGGLGAAIGAGIDAAIKGPKVVVYRAPGTSGSASLSLAPMITPRTKGVAVALSF